MKKRTYDKAWYLKVYRKNKALFYLAPYFGSFTLNMAIREKEREEFLKDESLSELSDIIENAKKYNEGYAIQLDVYDESSFNICNRFITKLISKR